MHFYVTPFFPSLDFSRHTTTASAGVAARVAPPPPPTPPSAMCIVHVISSLIRNCNQSRPDSAAKRSISQSTLKSHARALQKKKAPITPPPPPPANVTRARPPPHQFFFHRVTSRGARRVRPEKSASALVQRGRDSKSTVSGEIREIRGKSGARARVCANGPRGGGARGWGRGPKNRFARQIGSLASVETLHLCRGSKVRAPFERRYYQFCDVGHCSRTFFSRVGGAILGELGSVELN